MLKNDRRPAPQIAQNDPPQVPNPGRPDFPSNDFQAPALPDFNFPQPNLNPPAAVPAPRLPDFPQGTPISGSIPVPPGTVSTPARGNTAVPNGEPIAAIASVEPLENVNPNGKVWVVLSNLREGTRTGFGSFNKPFLVDYQLASGSPVSTDNYVLHLSKSLGGGSFQQVADVPVKLETSGTIEFNTPPSFGPASGFVATMAVPNGRQKWTHLSGELTPGGTATAAVAPLSIVELAGADANGKLVVIANPKFAATPGLPTLEVGFVLQQPAAPTSYYFLVATTPTGQKVEFDIARNLRQATVNDESTFGGRLFGPGAQVKPPFTLHVEKRQSRYQSPIRPETPEVISNRINVAG
jgi:hypothetical protein